MATSTLDGFLQRLKQTLAAESLGELADRELLERYLTSHDEVAFQAILHRHGAMVFRVCRRVLPAEQDAEDAFQATFLTLARQARTIRKQSSLASWLHGVAYRAALKAQARAARRRECEAGVERPARTEAVLDDLSWKELRSLLDEELARLPDKLRAPLVLCYLEGQTQDEAAGQLGWTRITCRRNLERGRELLGRRLARRGVTLSAVLFAPLLSECAVNAAVPVTLLASTVTVGATASARVLALAEGLAPPVLAPTWKPLAALLLALLVPGIGAAVLTREMPRETPPPRRPQDQALPRPRQVVLANPCLVLAPEAPGELGLSAAQKDRIARVVQEADRAAKADGKPVDVRQQLHRLDVARCQALRKALPEILTPAQVRRFQQLQRHAGGLFTFFDPDVQQALALTAAQKAEIEAIGLEGPDWTAIDRAVVRDPRINPHWLHSVKKIPYVLELLDERQKRIWADLTGPDPFRGDLLMQVRWAYGLGILPSRPWPYLNLRDRKPRP
jgi:RNA polymerase sigma factor (sigma-70 family)